LHPFNSTYYAHFPATLLIGECMELD
jgi:hypothetical protein